MVTTYIRKNAWNNGGTFNNPDLLWYARAVGEMQSRALNDETSWWFFAGIHGHNWNNLPSPPNIPTSPQPTSSQQAKYWNQCQHGTWFFLPWHRGYLLALEKVLRGIIQEIDGPADWALPYWNYFGPDTQYQIPSAFTVPTLPDGKPNPLLVNARYGPKNNGNISIPLAAWNINQNCQKNVSFEGDQPDYYGGSSTGFEHSGYADRGSIEDNPHNIVHVAIGGQNPLTGRGGLMSVPDTAGLDPIFYLHHCNIDRMWAEWNKAGKDNPQEKTWLNGPTATGDRKFYMPNPDQSAWEFTPEMVTDVTQLGYDYEEIASIEVRPMFSEKAKRLRRIGFPLAEAEKFTAMKEKSKAELVGASGTSLSIGEIGARTNVKLETKSWNKVNENFKKFRSLENFAEFTEFNAPDEMYLQLEGVRGKEDSIVCTVSVNQKYVGHISFFGLQNATAKDRAHGGGGLTIKLDITKVVDELLLSGDSDVNNLDVLIQPVNIVAEGNELSVDRISIYRKPAQ